MKLLIFLFVILMVISTGCSSDSGSGTDPLSEFRTLSINLRQLVYDELTETGRGLANLPEDATDQEKEPYVTAIGDIYLSQLYCITVYNSIIDFTIHSFSDSVYTNTDRDMTIDVSNDEYTFYQEYFITIQGESSPEKISAALTYNPERNTWLFIGKRGGELDGTPPGDIVPADLWIKQEGAVVNDTVYYVSTLFHIEEGNSGTTHTTNAIVTYTGANPTLNMAGEHVSCISDCISESPTPIFTHGITDDIQMWDDFKMTDLIAIDYEINP